MSQRENVVIVFVKYPASGKVKTRLARSLGYVKAAHFYRNMADAVWRRTKSRQFERIICYTPSRQKEHFSTWFGKDTTMIPQQGMNLGERLATAFTVVFQQGAKRVIAIGTDSPFVSREDLKKAFRVLQKKQCVVGPTEDGGYYLIGLSQLETSIFQGISWSTTKVLSQTKKKLNRKRCSFMLLEKKFDVDTMEDLKKLKDQLDQKPLFALKTLRQEMAQELEKINLDK